MTEKAPKVAPAPEQVFMRAEAARFNALLEKFAQAKAIADQASAAQSTLKKAMQEILDIYPGCASVRHGSLGILVTRVAEGQPGRKFNEKKALKFLTAGELAQCFDKTKGKAAHLMVTVPDPEKKDDSSSSEG